MDRDRQNDTDAFKIRMQNRNRRKRPHHNEEPPEQDANDSSESRPPKRQSDESSDPDERNESGDSSSNGAKLGTSSIPNSQQQRATGSAAAVSNALFVSLGESPHRTGNEADILAPRAAAGLYSPSSMQAQSESQELPGMRRGHVEAVVHPPSLSMKQQQQQQQMQQALQMQHAFQQQQQMQHALALLATGGSGAYGNPFNDPSGSASLRGGFPSSGFPKPLPPFAAMDPSLLHLLRHPSMSSLSSDAGLSAAFARPSITSQHLLGGIQVTAAAAEPPRALPANMDRIEDLYMESDDDVLSSHQIIVRKQIEFFVARQEDIDNFTPGRRKELSVGQVGIRCKHCTFLPHKERPRGAAYFPSTLRALYQAAQNMASVHLIKTCQQINPSLKEQLIELQETKAVSGHGGKKYWAEGAMARGVYESEMGLRFRDD